jgi:tight adherence protein C
MRTSILIPTVLAFLGSVTLALTSNPRIELDKRIALSKDRETVQGRLRELGDGSSEMFEEFRRRQIARSLATSLTVLFAFLILRKPLLLSILTASFAAIFIYVLIDKQLSNRVKIHQLSVESEFPAVIEMYSLALSAGETPLSAMERIGNSAKGAMAIEFRKVVTVVKSGQPFHLALDSMGREFNSITIRRFIDSLIIATLRGAPVIEVLQRHALEAREAQRNRVLSAAAKAEISMMIPVVFLILPISILFALWPSLANLNLFSSA